MMIEGVTKGEKPYLSAFFYFINPYLVDFVELRVEKDEKLH